MKAMKDVEDNKGLLATELKEKLDWYLTHTSEEEYDEKAVESILYLLDKLEPIKEDKMPQTDKAWEQFLRIVEQREPSAPQAAEGEGMEKMALAAEAERMRGGQAQNREAAGHPGGPVPDARKKSVGAIAWRKGVVAAAAIIFLVLTGFGAMQAAADPDTGFFHWLKRDETGTQMVTSPENLNNVTDCSENVFYNRKDVPNWAQEWLQVEEAFEMPENYEWQRIEVNSSENIQSIVSFYLENSSGAEVLLGAICYIDKISYSREGFIDYSFIQDYEVDTKQMEIYSKTEESGEIFYAICFIDSNKQYFIQGQDKLDELKDLAEQYYECVKPNRK